ncbi:protein of unknown function [Aminobacter niigataensis]|nr:protein of unknown function [Aminobacter niigataensis]
MNGCQHGSARTLEAPGIDAHSDLELLPGLHLAGLSHPPCNGQKPETISNGRRLTAL